jgi:hypothetical protein
MCNGCGAPYRNKWPGQCPNRDCGRLDYTYFSTSGEQERWALLILREAREKSIRNLKRQVPYALYTIEESTGARVKFAEYIADFVYDDVASGTTIIEDFKPDAGSDPMAKLKMRCMEASGRPVRIITSKGYV